MAEWREAPDLRQLAIQIIAKRPEVDHVDVGEVLFLWELETSPKASARCYRLDDHPIGYFTDKKWAIVVYQANCDYMTRKQLAILLLHELMHIPAFGDKLVQHTVQDFKAVLRIDIDWDRRGQDVPDILE